VLALSLVLACGGWRKQLREGDDWMSRDNPGAAARAYAKAEKARPEDLEIQLLLARALLADGQAEEAVPHAELAYEEGLPGSPEVYARALLGAGRSAEVIPVAQKEISSAEDDRFHLLLARAELGRGDLTAARYWYEEALKRGTSLELRAGAAYVRARLGDGSKVGSVTLDARDDVDTPQAVWAELGAAWLAAGDWTNGRNAGAQVLAIDPSVNADDGLRGDWIRSAEDYAAREQFEPALHLAFMAASLDLDDADLAWKIGAWAAAAGDWALAARWLEHALVTPPYDAPEESLTSGVAVASSAGGLELSERRRIRREVGRSLSLAYQKLGDPASEARAWGVVLRSTDEADPEAWHQQAIALFRAGDFLGAARSARTATSQGHPDSAAVAARAYRRLGDLENAAAWAMTAWESHPGDPDLALMLAELYERDKRYEAALGVIDKGLAAHPEHQGLQRARARLLSL
jgi:tetratricopeptide (TPR) repeat protein